MHLVVVLSLGLFMGILCLNDSDSLSADVYIVTLKQAPASHYYGEFRMETNVFKHGSTDTRNKLHRPRHKILSPLIFCNRFAFYYLNLLLYSMKLMCLYVVSLFC